MYQQQWVQLLYEHRRITHHRRHPLYSDGDCSNHCHLDMFVECRLDCVPLSVYKGRDSTTTAIRRRYGVDGFVIFNFETLEWKCSIGWKRQVIPWQRGRRKARGCVQDCLRDRRTCVCWGDSCVGKPHDQWFRQRSCICRTECRVWWMSFANRPANSKRNARCFTGCAPRGDDAPFGCANGCPRGWIPLFPMVIDEPVERAIEWCNVN